MATKKQDTNVVTERRLKPIYDCLDIGNNKMALQEAEKLLKKQPDLICAKALRALALIRLSRHSEATSLLAEIEKQEPDEEYTLQALTYCFRDLGKPENIITFYERAAKKNPQNEEFLSHLMMAYVRVGDHKKQQTAAMQLYKLKPAKNPYYFWAVMSIVMQAYKSDDPKLAREVYLPMAERMIQKFIETDKLNAEAEVKLYVLILEMQEKFAEAIQVLQGDLTKRFVKTMWECQQKIIYLLGKLNRWQEIFDMCENELPNRPDDWFLWTHFLTGGFELIEADPSRKVELIDKMTAVVLAKPRSDDSMPASKDGPCRGPHLARLHLISNLLERDFILKSELGTSLLGEPKDLLLEYFRIFGDKPSLSDDIRSFLHLLGEDQQNWFMEELEKECGGLPLVVTSSQTDSAFAQNLKQMSKHQAALQVARCLGRHAGLSMADKQALVVDLVRRYEAAAAFGSDLQVTEMNPTDIYVLLALHTMWDIFNESGDAQHVCEMLLLGEQCLRRGPSNFRLKSLLMKLYSLVGGGVNVVKLSESMDLKYVLRDSLGYFVCDQLTPWGLYGDLAEWSRVSLAFYTQSEKEIIDGVVQCYKAGSFPKIVEFHDFRNSLRRSYHFHACRMWRQYFSLINDDGANLDSIISILKDSSPAYALKHCAEWSSYDDHCDYTMNPCWDPVGSAKLVETKRGEIRQEQIAQLQFYELTLALLSLLSGAESSSPECCSDNQHHHHAPEVGDVENGMQSLNLNVNIGEMDEQFTSIFNHLRAHCKNCTNESPIILYSPDLNSSVGGHFGIYLNGNYFEVLLMALETIYKYLKESIKKNETEAKDGETKFMPADDEVMQLLKAMISSHQLQGNGFPFMQLCHVSYLVQTFTIILTAINLTTRRIRAMRQSNQASGSSKEKKQKKKKGQTATAVELPPEDPLTTEFFRFASVFYHAAMTTSRLVEDLAGLLDAETSVSSLMESRIIPAEFCSSKSDTIAGLKSSYKQSIKDMNRVITQQISTAASVWYKANDGDKVETSDDNKSAP